MNNTEFEKLQQSDLSHEARSLYLFFIRPRAEKGIFYADLGEITAMMHNTSAICPFAADPEICRQLMQELFTAGLLQEATSAEQEQGRQYSLPYFAAEGFTLPALPFVMHQSWRPGPAFAQTALFSGLTDTDFAENELQSFITYWSCKPERRNQNAWERTFAQRLKRSREAKVRKGRAQTGATAGQMAETASGIAEKAGRL